MYVLEGKVQMNQQIEKTADIMVEVVQDCHLVLIDIIILLVAEQHI